MSHTPDNITNKINTESKKINYTELYGREIGFTTLAIIITIIISMYFIILIKFKTYHKAWKDNENNIRCNPIYMPFSKYISSGPLFEKPISGSENMKSCVNNISANFSSDYNSDFKGVFTNIEKFYNMIIDSITQIGVLFQTLKRSFQRLIQVIMNRFSILSNVIKSIANRIFNMFSIFPDIFMIFWSILLEFVNIMKYALVYLVNLLYKCIIGPIASLVTTISTWAILLIVFFLIALYLMLASIPFGPWPFFLGATVIFAILMVVLIPISFYLRFLFIILMTVINLINKKVMQFIDSIDTGINIDTARFDAMRSAYIIKKEYEGGNNLFSSPSFDECKKLFK
tara:strand:- start:2591 stop:3619 length:1029 start_codon:yes stop_codon:yes gene_type:complete